MKKIACFVSPHGFGHAARSCALINSLYSIDPSIKVEIFTLVPEWFFKQSVSSFNYHSLITDIGLVQKNPLTADIPATLRKLKSFLPFDKTEISKTAGLITSLNCNLVVCDISPMGIAVAKAAGLPSVLVENFTWDWIYEGYVSREAGFAGYIDYLREVFDSVDYRIQTEPVCRHRQCDVKTGPVSRRVRKSSRSVRKSLGVKTGQKLVMITMGGIPAEYNFLDRLKRERGISFILPGASDIMRINENLILLPHNSDLYHPDLINVCDAVIGKTGYSTLAEVYSAGVPFGYMVRPGFRESKVIAEYIDSRMSGLRIKAGDFNRGNLSTVLEKLLSMPKAGKKRVNGADKAAHFIYSML